MGVLDDLIRKKDKNTAELGVPNLDEFVIFRNEKGEERKLSKAEWRKSYLHQRLVQAVNSQNSQNLFLELYDNLQLEFYKDSIAYAKKLYEWERASDRSIYIYARILIEMQEMDKAETLLMEGIVRFPDMELFYSLLSRVFYIKRDLKKSEEFLWKALRLNPNEKESLQWLEIAYGEDAFINLLHEVAKLPNSWWAPLVLVSCYTRKKNIIGAKPFIEQCLNYVETQPNVVDYLSGFLVQGGYLQELIAYIAPLYGVRKHPPAMGLDLLTAYLETRNIKAGKLLLSYMKPLGIPEISDALATFSQKFEALESGKNPDTVQPVVSKQSAQQLQMEAIILDKPIWYDGLLEPEWILEAAAPIKKSEICVAFVPWAYVRSEASTQIRQEFEDDAGRMTRSLPLFLSESLFFQTNIQPLTAFLLAKGVGPILYGKEWIPDFSQLGIGDKPKPQYIVTGTLRENPFVLELVIYDGKKREEIKRFRFEFQQAAEIAKIIFAVKQKLFDFLIENSGMKKMEGPSFYDGLREQSLMMYLLVIGQAFVLYLVKMQKADKESLWGVDNILKNPLAFHRDFPDKQMLMYCHFAILGYAKWIQNPAYQGLQEPTFAWLEECKGLKYAQDLIPFACKIFNREHDFQKSLQKLKQNSPSYQRWIEKMKQGNSEARK